ncbi:MAG: methionine synthase, partial [Anaerolineaceae bacterium]|nr:methionine synthase [Anaerolineaceae bacterium]
ARAHLASSIYLQMAMKPDIIHIVGHTEADHAATGTDVIDATLMARKAIENAINGQPDPTQDPQVLKRIDWLISQANITLQAISKLADGPGDSYTDPQVLGKALRKGILDAPHLKNSKIARGLIKTQIINGACETVDNKGNFIEESQRLKQLF